MNEGGRECAWVHAYLHRLEGDQYKVHGQFTRGQHAASALLNGFVVDVAALFAAADEIPD